MKEEKRVYEVSKTIIRETTDKERFQLIYDDEKSEWLYHAPNAQVHTAEQLETILDKLKSLNGHSKAINKKPDEKE